MGNLVRIKFIVNGLLAKPTITPYEMSKKKKKKKKKSPKVSSEDQTH